MKQIERRTFIKNTTSSIAGISLLGTSFINRQTGFSKDIGIQLYSLAKPLSDDFLGTLKKLSGFGYKNIEFAGPYYFSTQQEIENNPLVSIMGLTGYGYYGFTPKEIRNILDDLGMKSTSAHIADQTLNHSMDEAITAAVTIGQKYLLSPMFIGNSLDDYKAAAETYNTFGEKCKSAGIQYGYHTHSQEFAEYKGGTPFEILVTHTDPELVTFELDLFWAAVAGVNPVELIATYPGRVKLLHIKEMAREIDKVYNTNEPFTNLDIGRKLFENQTVVGDGIIDFLYILKEVQFAGIEYLIIESDFPKEPMRFAEQSISNLQDIVAQL